MTSAPVPSVRSLVANWFLALGLLAAAVALPATWAQQQLLDTREYTDAVAPLIEEKAVQESVSAALTHTILTQAGFPPALEPVMREGTDLAVATDQFAKIWKSTVSISHRKLVEAMRDEGAGLSVADDGLRVELSPLVRAITARLTQAGVPLADRLPTVEGSFVLDDSPALVAALKAGQVLDRVATPLALLAVALLAAGVVAAEHRLRRLVQVGLYVAGLAVGEWLLWFVILEPVLMRGADETARLVVDALTGSSGPWLLVVAVLGLLVAAAGWLLRRRRPVAVA